MLQQNAEDYCCAIFQVIPITGFGVIVLAYTPAHIHRDKVIAVSVPSCYIVDMDKKYFVTL